MSTHSVIVDGCWASDRVSDKRDNRGFPIVRPATENEDTRRFKVVFRVFGREFIENGKLGPIIPTAWCDLAYYGLDFADCKHKMLVDTEGAAFNVVDVVDTYKDWHKTGVAA